MRWLRLQTSFCHHVVLMFCLVAGTPTCVSGQETEQATRQFAVAVGFQNQKLYEPAIEEWQSFLKKFPQDPRLDKATHYLGTCQLQAKQYPQAAATFEQVVQTYPKFTLLDQTLLNLGTAWYNMAQESKKPEDYAKGELSFARVPKEFPKSEFVSRALFYRGESLYHQNKLKEAADSYTELLQRFPKDDLAADALYALGICHEARQQPAEAQKTFASFQAKFPKHPLLAEVRMRQAESLFAENKFADAQAQFALVSVVKDFPLADTAMLRQARCLYELNKFEQAGALYWNVPREFPKTKSYDSAVLAGAKCYYLAGKYAAARSGLENVASRNVPEAAEASQWIARSLLKEKKPADAIAVLDAAMAKHAQSPAFPQLMLARIDALYDLPQRRAETVALYGEFAQKYPGDELAAQARYMAALTALDLGDHAAAKANSNTFLQQYPKDKLAPDVQFISAESRLLLREFNEAEQLYRTFLAASPAHPNAPQAKVRLGLALQLAEQHDDALRAIEAALNDLKDPALKSEAMAIAGRCYLAKQQLEKAAETFELSLKTMPTRDQSDQTLLTLADVYRRLNRPKDGATRLNTLKANFPGSPLAEEAAFRLGEMAYLENDFDTAVAQYTAVVSKWPDGTFAPHAQYGMSWAHFKKNEFQDSVKAVNELTKRYSKSELAGKGLYVRAMAEFQLGQFAAAAETSNEFLKTGPPPKETLDTQYLRGLSLAGQEKFAEAAKIYASILQADAKYADADKVLYELGWACFESGQRAESDAAFQRLANEYPQSPLAAESLFRVAESFYDAGKYAEAADVYTKTRARTDVGDLGEKAAHKLGWSFFKVDKFPEAAAAFSEQLKSYPDGSLAGDGQFLVGESLYKQKQWKPAMDQYAAVIAAKNPTYQALATYRSGECAAALEQWDASFKFHQQVLDRFADFELLPEARYGAGWALQQQDKLNEAVAYYERVTEETDTETAAKARFMIGEACFAQKNHKEATRHFLKAAFAYSHKEWSAMAWFEAARCFEVLRDVDQAKNCYQQMIEKFPEHPKVEDAKKRLAQL